MSCGPARQAPPHTTPSPARAVTHLSGSRGRADAAQRPINVIPDLPSAPFPDPIALGYPEVQDAMQHLEESAASLMPAIEEDIATCLDVTEAPEGLQDPGGGTWNYTKVKPSTLKTLDPQPSTLNPKPETRNPKPETLNPKPERWTSKAPGETPTSRQCPRSCRA